MDWALQDRWDLAAAQGHQVAAEEPDSALDLRGHYPAAVVVVVAAVATPAA